MSHAAKKGVGARGAKKAGGPGPGTGKGDDKSEDVLQAVVLTDSFQDRFRPLTIDRPRCLLPLANTPLIEYTLEFLAMNGVQEVYVYCSAHADQIEAYLAESRWATKPARRAPSGSVSGSSPFQKLELVRVAQATSLGDFLRDLDKRGTIAGDFVLVHGDLVANVPLDGVLARHRARREANRDAVMTLVLREAGVATEATGAAGQAVDHHTRAHGIDPLFVLEAGSGRCLEYNEMTALDRRPDRFLTLDPAFLEKRSADIEIRADLIDCGIDICTPDVLALWTESFDCELPRKNFLHNVLKDWELNGKLIYADIITDSTVATTAAGAARSGSGTYAARVASMPMYDAISRDVLGRWTFPMVPDTNLLPGHSYAALAAPTGSAGTNRSLRPRRGVWAERGVTVSPTATVSRSVLGLHTTIEAGSVVSGCTLGRRCRIGRNVRMDNCYLWDDVVVGDNTVLTQSLLAAEVHVGCDCILPAGSLLSFGVIVDSNVQALSQKPSTPAPLGAATSQQLPPALLPWTLSRVKADGTPVTDDPTIVGAGGRGAEYRYPREDDDDNDDDNGDSANVDSKNDDDSDTAPDSIESLQRSLIYSVALGNVSTSSISSFGSDVDGEDNDDDDEIAVFDDDDEGDHSGDRTKRRQNGPRSRLSSFASLGAYDSRRQVKRSGDGDDEAPADARGGAGGSGPDEDDLPDDGVGAASSFHTDAVNGLLDALHDDASGDFESARLEFMGLRLSTNASDGAVCRALAAAFARRAEELTRPGPDASSSGGLDATKAAEKAVTSKRGAARFIRDVALGGGGGGTTADQVEFVLALQRTLVGLRIRAEEQAAKAARAAAKATEGADTAEAAATTTTMVTAKKTVAPGTLLAALLQQLYENDVLEEEGILAWWGDWRATVGGGGAGGGSSVEGGDGNSDFTMAGARERCRVLVDWLETAEEDSDDSDEEDDDEDDEDDDDE